MKESGYWWFDSFTVEFQAAELEPWVLRFGHKATRHSTREEMMEEIERVVYLQIEETHS